MLSTRRTAKGTNRISQTIKDLQPGRVYHVNVYAFDPNKIDRKVLIPLSVEINGAEMISGKDEVLKGKSGKPKSRKIKDDELYTAPVIGGTPITIHHYNRLFWATSETAELVLSDWPSVIELGGVAGEEILWDFIEMAPDESLNFPAIK